MFVLSDFIDSNFKDALKIANRKHDVVALNIFDDREQEIPDMGIIPFKNLETDTIEWIDTSNAEARKHYKKESLKFKHELEDLFKKAGIDYTDIATNKSYVKPLLNVSISSLILITLCSWI